MRNDNMVKTIEIKNQNGQVVGTKEVVCYPALLDRAHQESLKRINTQLIQFPSEGNQNTAVFQAEVETEKGVFSGTGDANPENVDPMIVPHIIRMAETRAKARALRDAVNIGVVAVEELGLELNRLDVLEVKRPTENPAEKADTGKSKKASSKKSKPEGNSSTDKKTLAKASGNKPDRWGEGEEGSNGNPQEELMTYPQRRYLFRLLAGQGRTGEAAHDFLLERFKVSSLKEVTKAQAHELIDMMLKETEGIRV